MQQKKAKRKKQIQRKKVNLLKKNPKIKKLKIKKPENTATGSSDYSKLISYMEKETGGKTKVLF